MGHFYTGEAFDLSFQTDYVTGKITPCRFLKEDFEFRAFVIRNLDGSLTFFGIEGKIPLRMRAGMTKLPVKEPYRLDVTSCWAISLSLASLKLILYFRFSRA